MSKKKKKESPWLNTREILSSEMYKLFQYGPAMQDVLKHYEIYLKEIKKKSKGSA